MTATESNPFVAPTNAFNEAYRAKDTKRAKGELEKIADLVLQAGGVPNSRFRRALAAVRALDREVEAAAKLPPPVGSTYRVTLVNGRETNLFVAKGDDIFAAAKREHLEIYSFVKI